MPDDTAYNTMIGVLEEKLPLSEGLERKSIEYKIQKIHSVINGDTNFSITTTKIVNKKRLNYKIIKDRNLAEGYRKLILAYAHARCEIEPLYDFLDKKLMLLEKELFYTETGSDSHNEFQKISGTVELEFLSIETDPIFEVKYIHFYLDDKFRYSVPISEVGSAAHRSTALALENNSELEMYLVGEGDMLIGMIYLPCDFFISQHNSILNLDLRNYNYVKARIDFKNDIKLIRKNAEIICVYKEGHGFENRYSMSPKYCGVCSTMIPPFSNWVRCFRCKFTCHKKCSNFVFFKCHSSINLDVVKITKSYNIEHVLMDRNTSGFRYCGHCGDRIAAGEDCLYCSVCKLRFHKSCQPMVFSSCGMDLELRHKMAEFNPPIADDADSVQKMAIKEFSLLKVLGRGSFGKVMLAKHKKTKEIVALKILKKEKIVNTNDLIYIELERRILKLVSDYKHPFLMQMKFCFQDKSNLYFGTEYLPGGDLFHHALEVDFTEDNIRLFAAEILTGLSFLHSQHVIYRDMKLDNILLTSEGHIKIADFGLAKDNIGPTELTYTYCGTPDTIAPEVIKGGGYSKVADWWSYGVVLFELYEKVPPFIGVSPKEMSDQILTSHPEFKSSISKEGRSLIKGLLEKDPLKRLGYGEKGEEMIKKHPYFKNINWCDVLEKRLVPDFTPGKGFENFDKEFTELPVVITPSASVVKYDKYFKNFK